MIQLYYGTDTNKTDHVAQNVLIPLLKEHGLDIKDKVVAEIAADDWKEHDVFIIGVPTWYYGDLQSDWEAYFPTLQKVDFTNKTVAIFGLGDQWGYDEWFVDGIGILADALIANGADMIGAWPNEGYTFQKSKALKPDGTFHGLALDEDNQWDLTEERCKQWVDSIAPELKRLMDQNSEVDNLEEKP